MKPSPLTLTLSRGERGGPKDRVGDSIRSLRAYTLFEVLLSLALMSVVLLLMTAAIDTHLRHLVANRMEVEEAQLARAVLEKIAMDIRSVVVAAREEQLEVDTETLSLFFGSYAADEAALYSAAGGTSTTATADEESEEETTIYGEMPGIYGDAEWIQIDTARLPRGEMYGSKQVRTGSTEMPDRLSPSKTVLYYLGTDTGQVSVDDSRYDPDRLIGSLGRSLDRDALKYGLFRRQLDRMVTQYALTEGLETKYEEYDEPLAPEVERIEFLYYDPSSSSQGEDGEWLDYWDMDEMQTLPTAVQITVAIRQQHLPRSFWSSGTAQEMPTIVYSLVVPIPVTLDPVEEETSEETTTQ